MLEKLFKLKANGTDVKTEVLAGITTFMTMAYILAVNPSILAADLAMTEFFLQIGIDELSVAPDQVLSLRKRIREIQ